MHKLMPLCNFQSGLAFGVDLLSGLAARYAVSQPCGTGLDVQFGEGLGGSLAS